MALDEGADGVVALVGPGVRAWDQQDVEGFVGALFRRSANLRGDGGVDAQG